MDATGAGHTTQHGFARLRAVTKIVLPLYLGMPMGVPRSAAPIGGPFKPGAMQGFLGSSGVIDVDVCAPCGSSSFRMRLRGYPNPHSVQRLRFSHPQGLTSVRHQRVLSLTTFLRVETDCTI